MGTISLPTPCGAAPRCWCSSEPVPQALGTPAMLVRRQPAGVHGAGRLRHERFSADAWSRSPAAPERRRRRRFSRSCSRRATETACSRLRATRTTRSASASFCCTRATRRTTCSSSRWARASTATSPRSSRSRGPHVGILDERRRGALGDHGVARAAGRDEVGLVRRRRTRRPQRRRRGLARACRDACPGGALVRRGASTAALSSVTSNCAP